MLIWTLLVFPIGVMTPIWRITGQGGRNKSLASILAVLAQDPDSGIITYGDSSIRHENQAQVVIEFLDFYRTHGLR